ncbi:hypothetical protein [Moorena producens]|uniref:hypothetical protein n=1 Tax=Moorena producens TaxID=1155739 RepID=UPI001314E2B2|nr:hypothetical protein [Moorena producens]
MLAPLSERPKRSTKRLRKFKGNYRYIISYLFDNVPDSRFPIPDSRFPIHSAARNSK